MKNRTFLSKLTMSGIKNIEKPITIEFMNYKSDQTPGKKATNPQSYKTATAIYGPNGSGKSAIIHSIEILHEIIYKRAYLLQDQTQKYLSALMNHKLNEIIIEVDFYFIENEGKATMYRYSLTLSKRTIRSSNYIDLTSECLSRLKPTKEIILHISDGKLLNNISKIDNMARQLKETTFHNRSVFDFLINEPIVKDYQLTKADIEEFIPFFFFIGNIDFFIDTKDSHIKYKRNIQDANEYYAKLMAGEDIINIYYDDEIPLNMIESYREYIKGMAKFINLFIPNIIDINAIEKRGEETFKIILEFQYDHAVIDIDFESTGVKKLCALYRFFANLQQGSILFIDELDSSINDVYLITLVEYFADYCDGQVIFTTHNTSPMDVMNNKYRNEKSQICFLDSDNNISVWKKIGSFSPSSMYKKGLIKGMQFTLESYDLIDIFDRKE